MALRSLVTMRRVREDDIAVSGDAQAVRRRAIIDIGSNSVRLVVYDGAPRSPVILFNEKVLAGLGAALGQTGRIEPEAMERGLLALVRYAALCREMRVDRLRCVATAAVRDATNGHELIARAEREAGLAVEILSGRQEGEAAGYGVLSAIPGADGIVGDLGGGSLELARIRDGAVHQVVSLPLGVLRLGAIRKRGKDALRQTLSKQLKAAGWREEDTGLPFYMVGGSWRALAHLDMQLNQVSLPIIHHHSMPRTHATYLLRVASHRSKASLKSIPTISSSRAATLADAAALLAALVGRVNSSHLVVSAHGLREGLLYQDLSAEDRMLDPLLAAAEAEGESQGRFAGHGRLIDDWIKPLFASDPPEWKRIRRAACLLADVGWRANPDFRAERGMEIALHGNWVGIDVAGRAMLAQALHGNFGGGATVVPELAKLAGDANAPALQRAVHWGLAIRLAQRLSGGVAGPLRECRLVLDGKVIALHLPRDYASLQGESVQRRLKMLAAALRYDYRITIAE
ncbi:Ppx/GppA family phosphatase [Sphingobium subterraneum]|uniref:Exopolyphosphatase/guanosine-5'-triphosphate, 3'-diphosphate pyrophosphatase n=1 Tax=Sphingobium subterraneum TaxID=627688 RepID=A0A841J2U6_9SPHN|nr:Ppx/GppA family phosphatase [Sphingobium subterraneum]MBB6125064.1 exopolyphosphatase/guanosine-5'-triphosphate,3'-diphosphate pyrophosphatase [Sphingobium subterraneum]